jgi:periplasmic copper chaperone A
MRKMLMTSQTFRHGAGLVGVLSVLALAGALSVTAAPAPPPAPQPVPAAPAAPAVNPAAPGAPAPTGETAAKARAAAVAAKANIDVGDAWTRATSGETANVFFRITSVKDADKLLSIDVATANKAAVQDQPNGRPLDTLEIPAGQSIDLKPGGRHLSLTGLKAPLKEGESFLVTLKFEKAGTESIAVKVLNPSANGLPAVGSTRKGDTTAAVSQR